MSDKKVLIGEDSSVIQNLVRQVLEQQQYEVRTAKNGKEVLEKLEKDDYALVLLDIFMPVMDGFACLAAIRELKGDKKEVPVFAITGNASNFPEEHFLNAGFNEVLVKPLDFDLLVGLTNAYLTNKV
jgi:CheY-like chemotaxis protein